MEPCSGKEILQGNGSACTALGSPRNDSAQPGSAWHGSALAHPGPGLLQGAPSKPGMKGFPQVPTCRDTGLPWDTFPRVPAHVQTLSTITN